LLGKPVLATGVAVALVHALLDDAPSVPPGHEEEAVVIKLIAVQNRRAINLGGEAAGVDQWFGLVPAAVAGLANIEGRSPAGRSLAAADNDADIVAAALRGFPERAANG